VSNLQPEAQGDCNEPRDREAQRGGEARPRQLCKAGPGRRVHLKFRTPRVEVKEESYLRETIKLCHPKMLFIIVCLASIGHLLTPNPFSVERYLLGIVGTMLCCLSAYRINEVADSTTSKNITEWEHKLIAGLFLAGAVFIGTYLALTYAIWIYFLAGITVVMLITYNMLHHPLIHNRVFYSILWGGIPIVFNALIQALNPIPTPTVILFGAWACVISVLVLWSWGPTTCGRMQTCSKAQGSPHNRLCHSPTLRCKEGDQQQHEGAHQSQRHSDIHNHDGGSCMANHTLDDYLGTRGKDNGILRTLFMEQHGLTDKDMDRLEGMFNNDLNLIKSNRKYENNERKGVGRPEGGPEAGQGIHTAVPTGKHKTEGRGRGCRKRVKNQ
jgi:hypothetical protein